MPVDINFKQEPLYQREIYYRGGISRIYWDLRDKAIFSYLNENDNIILDVGCGEGITLEKLNIRLHHKQCIGIDGMMENILICKRHSLPVVGADLLSLPFNSNSIDSVLFIEVIEHLYEVEKAISEIKRVLKKHGKLIILFPNDRNFKLARILTLKFKEANFDSGHVKQWTPRTIFNLLNSHGFYIIKQKNIPFFLWQISLHHIVVCKKS
ncbi:MAG: class I SAM-dependent methyltransferase [Desulfobacterales bacterium]|nr:class I SAM-dependent methyltransferase [Desulfobacterales bacterium]